MSETARPALRPEHQSILTRLRNWAVLMRLEYVGLSTIALMGGLTCAPGMPWHLILTLFVLNGLVVAFGFIHNDIADIEIDRRSRSPVGRLLVTGAVSRREAWLLCAASYIIAAILHVATIGRIDSFLAMTAAFVFTGIYNVLGKKLFGADLFYGLSAAFGGLFGFLAVRDVPQVGLLAAPLTLAFMLSVLANHTFLNAIEGGLKDIPLDRKAGVTTFPIVTKVREENGRLLSTRAFRWSAYALRALALAACWYPLATGLVTMHPALVAMMVLCSVLSIISTVKLVNLPTWDREVIGRLTRRGQSVSGALFVFIIASQVSLSISLFIIIAPMICYASVCWILYGNAVRNPPTY